MSKKVEKEVADETHLRRMISEEVERVAEEEEAEIKPSNRNEMVDNIMAMIQEPIEILVQNTVSFEMSIFLSEEEDEPEEPEEEEPEEPEEEEED